MSSSTEQYISHVDHNGVRPTAATHVNESVLEEGLTREDVINRWNNISADYDKEFIHDKYLGPSVLSEAVRRLIPEQERDKVKILDIAAGTGLVGIKLSKLGFKHIDALEPAEKMVSILKSQTFYGRVMHDLIGEHKLDIEDETYDLVVMSGAIIPKHIPIEGFKEMIRCLKPGGYLVNAMREEYIHQAELKDLEPFMEELEQKGVWTRRIRQELEGYFYEKLGLLHVYEKCPTREQGYIFSKNFLDLPPQKSKKY